MSITPLCPAGPNGASSGRAGRQQQGQHREQERARVGAALLRAVLRLRVSPGTPQPVFISTTWSLCLRLPSPGVGGVMTPLVPLCKPCDDFLG